MKHYIITETRTEAARVIAICRENMIGVTSRRLTSESDIIEVRCGLFKMIKLIFSLKLLPKFSAVFGLKKL